MNNNLRSGNVDIAKFVACLLIMAVHSYKFEIGMTHFGKAGIFVEFFLIISGYYSAKHFDNHKSVNKMRASIIYTIKKFFPLLPYTTFITLFSLLFNAIWNCIFYGNSFFTAFDDSIYNVIFDLLLLSSSYGAPLVKPIWYLSAMMIVFPLFTRFLQISNRYAILSISFTYSILYYGLTKADNGCFPPECLLRVLAGLCFGAFIYQLYTLINPAIHENGIRILLTIVECIMFMLAILLVNNDPFQRRLILLCFIVCLSIMLPGLSYTAYINGRFANYLGRLSVSVYLLHWGVGKLILGLTQYRDIPSWGRITLYYGLTILFSMIALKVVDNWKWFKNIKEQISRLETD